MVRYGRYCRVPTGVLLRRRPSPLWASCRLRVPKHPPGSHLLSVCPVSLRSSTYCRSSSLLPSPRGDLRSRRYSQPQSRTCRTAEGRAATQTRQSTHGTNCRVCGGHVLHALSAAGGAGSTCPVADYSVFFVFFSHAEEGTIACSGPNSLAPRSLEREREVPVRYVLSTGVLARESQRSRRAGGPDAWR